MSSLVFATSLWLLLCLRVDAADQFKTSVLLDQAYDGYTHLFSFVDYENPIESLKKTAENGMGLIQRLKEDAVRITVYSAGKIFTQSITTEGYPLDVLFRSVKPTHDLGGDPEALQSSWYNLGNVIKSEPKWETKNIVDFLSQTDIDWRKIQIKGCNHFVPTEDKKTMVNALDDAEVRHKCLASLAKSGNAVYFNVDLSKPVSIGMTYEDAAHNRTAPAPVATEAAGDESERCFFVPIQKFIRSENAKFNYTFEYNVGFTRSSVYRDVWDDEKVKNALESFDGYGMRLDLEFMKFECDEIKIKPIAIDRKLGNGTEREESLDLPTLKDDFTKQIESKRMEKRALKVEVSPNQMIVFTQLSARCGDVILRGTHFKLDCVGSNCPNTMCGNKEDMLAVDNSEALVRLKAQAVTAGASRFLGALFTLALIQVVISSL